MPTRSAGGRLDEPPTRRARFGIHSGMPLPHGGAAMPRRGLPAGRCPGLLGGVRAGDGDAAHLPRGGRGARLDEAFLAAEVDDPARLAADIQAAVLARTGLACSIGIGGNKLQAKQATGFGKPAGIYQLTERELAGGDGRPPDFGRLGHRRPHRGEAQGRRHRIGGPAGVGRLAGCSRGAFGPTIGPSLKAMGVGLGPTEVSAEPYIPRSRSHETTFPTDLTDRVAIETAVTGLARDLAQDAATTGRPRGWCGHQGAVRLVLHPDQRHEAVRPGATTDGASDRSRPPSTCSSASTCPARCVSSVSAWSTNAAMRAAGPMA